MGVVGSIPIVSTILPTAPEWCAEGLNTAIELLGDEISMEHRERIGRAKDVAAFAVLVAASAAVVVGIVVFGRHLVPD